MPLSTLNSNSIINIELQYSLPLLITLSFSCIIFRYIVRPFSGFNVPDIGTAIPMLTAEQTLDLLNNIGLGFLTISGPFCTLIIAYLINLDSLTEVLNLNLSTLDPDVLRFMLFRLRFLIANHELIFGVMNNFVRMYENLDIDFDFDPDLLCATIRDAGNALYEVYRAIEAELNIDDSDLPIHWTEH